MKVRKKSNLLVCYPGSGAGGGGGSGAHASRCLSLSLSPRWFTVIGEAPISFFTTTTVINTCVPSASALYVARFHCSLVATAYGQRERESK